MSRIRWGTRLKVDRSTRELLYETGAKNPAWRRVDDIIPGLTLDEIIAQYAGLYDVGKIHDDDNDGVPDVWVFNDFGPWSLRYFVDSDRDRKLGPGETLMGEMVHTTPRNEAETAMKRHVQLAPSHGCIHVKPTDRDLLKNLGAFKRGTLLVVHPYEDRVPTFLERAR